MTDQLEVWHSTRGQHVPPSGYAFVELPNVWTDNEFHLVYLHDQHDDDGEIVDGPLRTKCGRLLDAEDEIIIRGRGRLCEPCAAAADLTEGLQWEPTG